MTDKLSVREMTSRLRELCQAGGFNAVFLTDHEGLPVAAVAPGRDAESDAAFLALLHRAAQQVRRMLHLEQLDEMSLVDGAGTRIVCRYLPSGAQNVFLVVIGSVDRPYRRLTNRFLREIAAWRQ